MLDQGRTPRGILTEDALAVGHQFLRDENSGKIRGTFATFSARGTTGFLVAEGEKLEKNLLDFDFRPSP
jgi:hypothetical protein